MRFQGASLVRLAQRQARQSFTHSPLLFDSCPYGASGDCSSDEGGFIFGVAIVPPEQVIDGGAVLCLITQGAARFVFSGGRPISR
jgi:hypothetical protein